MDMWYIRGLFPDGKHYLSGVILGMFMSYIENIGAAIFGLLLFVSLFGVLGLIWVRLSTKSLPSSFDRSFSPTIAISLPPIIVGAIYILVYAIWLLTIVISIGGLVGATTDALVVHSWPISLAIFFVILMGAVLPINVYMFSGSIRRLR